MLQDKKFLKETTNTYNYYEAVKYDILEYINTEYTQEEITEILKNDTLTDELYSELFVADSITGNASGSYWCNSWYAERCLLGNSDLTKEVLLFEFNYNNLSQVLEVGVELIDVMIRCHVLYSVLDEIKRTM